ncbi:MAG: hypothetical protein ABIH24_04535, partial [Verrucomicrobiota bacterium]
EEFTTETRRHREEIACNQVLPKAKSDFKQGLVLEKEGSQFIMIERIASLVFFHNTDSFGKIEIGPATAGPISSLPKPLLFFISVFPCLRGEFFSFSKG